MIFVPTPEQFEPELRSWVEANSHRINASSHFYGGADPDKCQEWQMYLRRAMRLLDGAVKPTLELATINVTPSLRRHGYCRWFTHVLEKEALSRGFHVYIENILNSNLEAFFRGRGYREASFSDHFGPTLFVDPTELAWTRNLRL